MRSDETTTIFRLLRTGSLFPLFAFLLSCNAPNETGTVSANPTKQANTPTTDSIAYLFKANAVTEVDRNIRSVFQDSQGNYWFGTNGSGVYRYAPLTGKLLRFTEKDGLFGNQVLAIQEDRSGNLWFGTGGFGVTRFDGRTFTTLTPNTPFSREDWKIEPDDLWFYAGGGTYRSDGRSLTYLPLAQPASGEAPTPPDRLSAYGVYCCLKDRSGNLWFGTQSKGVCRYDGTSFTWLTEKGLAGPAVLGLFEDSSGRLWFGTNGSGLFCYDPATGELVNFTEEKGLSNPAFRATGKEGPGTLARVYAINEDKNGVLWIGTIDAGVWRYDGQRLSHYTTSHGLTGNAVNTIYKDRKGVLWFGTDENGLCRFNGVVFRAFEMR